MTTEGPRLRVNLLGEPDVSWDGETLRIPSRKGLALVCYLAHIGAPLSRSELAEMLWPNSAARLTNLRWELHNLRSLSGAASWLSTPGRKVAVRAETDVERLDELLAEGRFAAALEMASAPFLNDLSLVDAPAFVEWLEDERALVADRHMRALAGEATRLESGSRLSEARELADRLLMLDPLDEAKHRTVMRLALKQGDLSVAAEQFEHCRRVLAQELGLQPTPETLELAAAIEQAATVRGPAVTRKRLPPELLRPPQLVGRQSEWERLGAAWDQQQIIFISGRPGIGKTRLAQDFIRSRVGEDVAVLRGHMGDQFLPFSGYSRGWRGVFSRRPELAEELPEWFYNLIAREPRIVRIDMPEGLARYGAIELETEQRGEVGEVWDDFVMRLAILTFFCGLVSTLIYITIGRALEPLPALSAAFTRLGGGDYGVRVEEAGPTELARLCTGFNEMAARLSQMETRNRHLNDQLATVQDEERADLARDLHDEVSPFLFSVDVDASTIRQMAEDPESPLAARADAIRDAVAHMKKHVKSILGRLRPAVHLELGLSNAIETLVASWQLRNPDVTFNVEVTDRGCGQKLDTVIHGIVREAIANAFKHGKPTEIDVRVTRDASEDVCVSVHDDGGGLQPGSLTSGFGLIAMRERVTALGGTVDIVNRKDRAGVAVDVRIPIRESYAAFDSSAGSEVAS